MWLEGSLVVTRNCLLHWDSGLCQNIIVVVMAMQLKREVKCKVCELGSEVLALLPSKWQHYSPSVPDLLLPLQIAYECALHYII